MNRITQVKVRLSNKTIIDCTIEATSCRPWKITFSGIDNGPREYDGDDLFEAMVALRKKLEEQGSLLLCAGARTDVFPSGMSRSMSGGRKAYVTRIGKPAGRCDIVEIFDYSQPELVTTVERQWDFHQEWMRSLKAQSQAVLPLPGEIEEAKRNPSGWVYRIAGRFSHTDAVPPEAIVGAWKVDSQGTIVGDFIENPNHDPKRWPGI